MTRANSKKVLTNASSNDLVDKNKARIAQMTDKKAKEN